jgi:hypothetical protein
MIKYITKYKLQGMPKDTDFVNMSFGQKIEFYQKIENWKKEAKIVYLSQKRKSYKTAIKEAIDLYNVKEYYCHFAHGENYSDDSFEFYYKS